MKKYCPKCDLPMFGYALIHNGQMETVWRCMSYHGTRTPAGDVKRIGKRRVSRGAKEIFAPLFGKALNRVD